MNKEVTFIFEFFIVFREEIHKFAMSMKSELPNINGLIPFFLCLVDALGVNKKTNESVFVFRKSFAITDEEILKKLGNLLQNIGFEYYGKQEKNRIITLDNIDKN